MSLILAGYACRRKLMKIKDDDHRVISACVKCGNLDHVLLRIKDDRLSRGQQEELTVEAIKACKKQVASYVACQRFDEAVGLIRKANRLLPNDSDITCRAFADSFAAKLTGLIIDDFYEKRDSDFRQSMEFVRKLQGSGVSKKTSCNLVGKCLGRLIFDNRLREARDFLAKFVVEMPQCKASTVSCFSELIAATVTFPEEQSA